MALTKRDGTYWAVEFAGEQVRLCCFRVAAGRVVVEECETRAAEAFDFAGVCRESRTRGSDEAEVLCAVPRSEVLLKPFTLPRSGAIDLHKVTALKLEQSVSGLDANSTLWGYMEDQSQNGERDTQVLAAAISREYVSGLMDRHFADSRHPTLLECSALAAIRAHLALRTETPECELVVDCATDGFSIFVLRDGIVESVHLVPAGRAVDVVLGEIRRLVLFLRGKRGGAPVETITCLGESAEQLSRALQDEMSLHVADGLAQPRQWIDNADSLPDGWDEDWHRVVGLIELVRTENEEAINFFGDTAPSRLARAVLPGVERFRTSVLAMGLAVLLAVGIFGQQWISQRRETRRAEVIRRAGTVAIDLQRQETARGILTRHRGERTALSNVFFELAELAPPGITLTTLTINPDGRVDVTGRCKKFSEADTFAGNLNNSKLFTSAETPSRRREKTGVVFKIAFRLTPASRRSTP